MDTTSQQEKNGNAPQIKPIKSAQTHGLDFVRVDRQTGFCATILNRKKVIKRLFRVRNHAKSRLFNKTSK
jgi:hypothetical protein